VSWCLMCCALPMVLTCSVSFSLVPRAPTGQWRWGLRLRAVATSVRVAAMIPTAAGSRHQRTAHPEGPPLLQCSTNMYIGIWP
jgi:hypothetical protein